MDITRTICVTLTTVGHNAVVTVNGRPDGGISFPDTRAGRAELALWFITEVALDWPEALRNSLARGF